MTRKQKDYAAEISSLVEITRRISQAHDVTLDKVVRDVELALLEDDNFTREQYLGIYFSIQAGSQARLTIPKNVSVKEAYYAYLTEWNDLIFRPVAAPGKSASAPIVEVQ
ncbi:MAG: hypothetical protein WC749_07665 [Dehalococcoidia bacterium]